MKDPLAELQRWADRDPVHGDAFRSIVAHLPGSGDPTLIILKGHLLLEGALDNALGRWIDDDSLRKSRLGFFQKQALLEGIIKQSIGPHDFVSFLWRIIRRVNTIRNKLVHEVENPHLSKWVDDLVQMWSAGGSKFEDDEQLCALTKVLTGTIGAVNMLTTVITRPRSTS